MSHKGSGDFHIGEIPIPYSQWEASSRADAAMNEMRQVLREEMGLEVAMILVQEVKTGRFGIIGAKTVAAAERVVQALARAGLIAPRNQA